MQFWRAFRCHAKRIYPLNWVVGPLWRERRYFELEPVHGKMVIGCTSPLTFLFRNLLFLFSYDDLREE